MRKEIGNTEKPSKKPIGNPDVGFVKIGILPHRNLTVPLDAVVEPDGDGFIARTVDLPLYGQGEDPLEAIEGLKNEIETLYEDLMEDDELTEEWLRIKMFLRSRIAEN